MRAVVGWLFAGLLLLLAPAGALAEYVTRPERVCTPQQVCRNESTTHQHCTQQNQCTNVPHQRRVCHTHNSCTNIPYTQQQCQQVRQCNGRQCWFNNVCQNYTSYRQVCQPQQRCSVVTETQRQCRTVQSCQPRTVTNRVCHQEQQCQTVNRQVWVPDPPRPGAAPHAAPSPPSVAAPGGPAVTPQPSASLPRPGGAPPSVAAPVRPLATLPPPAAGARPQAAQGTARAGSPGLLDQNDGAGRGGNARAFSCMEGGVVAYVDARTGGCFDFTKPGTFIHDGYSYPWSTWDMGITVSLTDWMSDKRHLNQAYRIRGNNPPPVAATPTPVAPAPAPPRVATPPQQHSQASATELDCTPCIAYAGKVADGASYCRTLWSNTCGHPVDATTLIPTQHSIGSFSGLLGKTLEAHESNVRGEQVLCVWFEGASTPIVKRAVPNFRYKGSVFGCIGGSRIAP